MQPATKSPENRSEFLLMVGAAWLVHVVFFAGVIVFGGQSMPTNWAIIFGVTVWTVALASVAFYSLQGRINYWRIVMFAVCCAPTGVGIVAVILATIGPYVMNDYLEAMVAIQHLG